eukprot:766215-Hanusia_phi.AAC.3
MDYCNSLGTQEDGISGRERSNVPSREGSSISVFRQDAMQSGAEGQKDNESTRSDGGRQRGSRPPSQASHLSRSSLSTSSTMRSPPPTPIQTPEQKPSRPPTQGSVLSSRASSRPPSHSSNASSLHDRPASDAGRASQTGEERIAQAQGKPIEALRLNLPVSMLPGRESEEEVGAGSE